MKRSGLNSWKSWGCALACSLMNFTVVIPAKLSGLLYVACVTRYNVERQKASHPIMVFYLVRFLGGPLIGYLNEIFGSRALCIFGSALAALGVAACFLAEDIIAVILLLGIVYGTGFLVVNALTPHIINQHFDKNVTNANGLTYAFSCLGALAVPPTVEFFFETYGVSGTFLILGGIMLNGVPVCMILKNPNYNKKTKVTTNTKTDEKSPCSDDSAKPKQHPSRSNPENGKQQSKVDHGYILQELNSGVQEKLLLPGCNLSNNGNWTRKNFDNQTINIVSDYESAMPAENSSIVQNHTVVLLNGKGASNNGTKELVCKGDDAIIECKDSGTVSKHKQAFQSFGVLLEPSFMLIAFLQSSVVFITIIVNTIMVDYARDKGIPESQGVYFVMFMPLGELCGSLGTGWVTDGGFLTKANYGAMSFLCLGICCACLVWATDFVTLMAGALFNGFFVYAAIVIFPSLVNEFFEPKKRAMALMSRMILIGPMSFTAAPMIGFFRGELGSYDWILYLMVVLSLISAAAMLLLPCVAKCGKNKQRGTH